MKKILTIIALAAVLAGCALEEEKGFVEKHDIKTAYVTDDTHVYAIWKTPHLYIGVEHDPECACAGHGGTHRPADSMYTFASNEQIDVNTMMYGNHEIMVFRSGSDWVGAIHSPFCQCAEPLADESEKDPWNTEIEINW